MNSRHAVIACLASAFADLSAQQTWIVDGGFQGNFVTIQEAVNAASDGDIILIRYASGFALHWDFVLTKGVTILGDDGTPRAGVVGHLTIAGLAPHQRVVLRSLEPDAANDPFVARVSVQNCAGDVVFDDVALSAESPLGFSYGHALDVQDCAHVALHRSTVHGAPGLRALDSSVTCSESSIQGRQATGLFGGGAAIGAEVTGCRVWLAGGACVGGCNIQMGSGSGPSRPGLVLRGSLAAVAGTVLEGGCPPRPAASVDLDAASWLFHDGATDFRSYLAGAIGNLSCAETGRVTGGLAAIGQPAVFTLDAAAGAVGILALSLPGPEVFTSIGSLWLYTPTTVLSAAGALPVQTVVTLPAIAPRGAVIALQGAVLHQGTLLLSTPLLTAAQ